MLSRPKQEVQERNPELGIVPPAFLVQELIDLCRGRKVEKRYLWFYKSFIPNDIETLFYLPPEYKNRPRTVEQVVEALRSSSWIVDDEDIIQQCNMIYWQRDVGNPKYSDFSKLMYLGRYLRNWLLFDIKLFDRQMLWEEHSKERYGTWLAEDIDSLSYFEPNFTLNSLFKKGPLDDICSKDFDKYLLYLWKVMGLSRKDLASILMSNVRQINRRQAKLFKVLQEKKDAS